MRRPTTLCAILIASIALGCGDGGAPATRLASVSGDAIPFDERRPASRSRPITGISRRRIARSATLPRAAISASANRSPPSELPSESTTAMPRIVGWLRIAHCPFTATRQSMPGMTGSRYGAAATEQVKLCLLTRGAPGRQSKRMWRSSPSR